MGFWTTCSLTVVAIGATSAYLLRRRLVRKWIDVRDDPTDLTGQTVILTGGNTGIGYEIALDLAQRGAHVVMGCRNMEQAQAAADSIQADVKHSHVSCLPLDLASLSSVRTFCAQVRELLSSNPHRHQKLRAVILNAGVWMPMEQQQTKTADGLEIHFGVNHLAHFLLVQQLVLENKDDRILMQSQQGCRIIFVSSTLAKQGHVQFENTNEFVYQGRRVSDQEQKKKSFAPPTGYCDSKLLNILCAKQLAVVLPSGMSANAVSPGFCRSSLGRNVAIPWYTKPLFAMIMRLVQRTPVQGAQNVVDLVIRNKATLQNGAMYSDGVVHQELEDYVAQLNEEQDAQVKLWELSEKLVEDDQ